jgi:hypothetical protein
MVASFDLKTCPICNKPLAVRMPKPGDFSGVKRYICSTHIGKTKISHYCISVGNNTQTQVIHVLPFTIHNNLNSDISEVYKWNNGVMKWVMNLPRLPLSVDKLVEKIKLYILFS